MALSQHQKRRTFKLTDERGLNIALLIAGFSAAITPAHPYKLVIVVVIIIMVIRLIINDAGSAIRHSRQFYQHQRHSSKNALKRVRATIMTTHGLLAAFEFFILTALFVTLTEYKIFQALLNMATVCCSLGTASLVYAIICENVTVRLHKSQRGFSY